jgi:serine/threonine protein kinase
MTAERFQKVAELLLAARERPDGERSGFLRAACGSDETLFEEVRSLLDAELHPAPRVTLHGLGSSARGVSWNLLDGEACEPTPLPESIGRYRVVRILGEGGMGTVYEARQEQPRRTVALKVIRPGLTSPALARRLAHEADILAQLQHPGIAQIYEAGSAEVRGATGAAVQPYIAMELVDGLPVTRYAEQYRLDLRARLGLMAQICDAVQHAHQRGVIHRDLKPSNILVVEHSPATHGDGLTASAPVSGSWASENGAGADARNGGPKNADPRAPARPATARPQGPGPRIPNPLPKVLDFGVARLMHGDGPTLTLQTQTGQIIGTLAYMSPEQVSGDARQLDCRADVYSLGVICYELLAGRPPFDLRNCSIPEAIRRIREDEPPAPSALRRALRGEIETIVLTAIARDAARRYQSAADLASDLRRFLAGEPIAAKRDSALYVLRKTARRFRRALAVAAGFLLLVSGFAIYASVSADAYRRLALQEREARQAAQRAQAHSEDARREADRQRDEAHQARDAQAAARLAAQREAERAQAVTTFLVEMLGLADPDITQSPDATVRQLLAGAGEQVDAALSAQPQAQATVRTVIGRAYASLGEPEAARAQLELALQVLRENGGTAAEFYEVLWPLYHVLGDLSDTGAVLRGGECVQRGRQVLTAACPELGARLGRLAGAGATPDDPSPAAAERDEIARLAADCLPADDPLWLLVGDQLYLHGHRLGTRLRAGPACEYLRGALEIYRRALPETHSRIVRTLGQLIAFELDAGDPAAAEQVARESIALLRRTLSDDHWYVWLYRVRLGGCLVAQGRLEEAAPLLRTGCEQIVAARGAAGRPAAEALRNLIRLCEAESDTDAAGAYRVRLGAALAGSAERMSWVTSPSAPDSIRMCFGPELAPLAAALDALKSELDRPAAESPLLPLMVAEVRASRSRLLPDDHPIAACVADVLATWAEHRYRRKLYDEATLALAREAAQIARASPVLYGRRKADAIGWLGMVQRVRGELAEAELCFREGLAILDTGFGTYGYSYWMRWQLGALLAQQRRFEEAEPLLLAGYQGLRRSVGRSDHNTVGARNELIALYERWERLDRFAEFACAALEQSLADGASARTLNGEAWRIARKPGLPPAAYEAALRAAEEAAALDPTNANILSTLGATRVRTGRFAAALDALVRADELHSAGSGGAHPVDWVFIALAEQGRGRGVAARSAAQRAAALGSQPRFDNALTRALLCEVHDAVAAP